MEINRERMWERFHKLADFGSVPGKPEEGITRYAFSPEYKEAAALLIQYMKEAEMTTWMDAARNIFGRLEGKKKDAPCLMLGSHFDTVTKGGRFDGLAGIAAALEIVTCIRENEIMFEYPIEIAALANEEACQFKGGVMGSKAMAGVLPLDHAQKTFDEEGHCLYDAMVAFGANPKHLECAVRKKGSIMAFLELHIEQAALLEQKELPVGMVTWIAGIHQLLIRIHGTAAHAGAVPMEERRDAMAAAVEIAAEVERLSCSIGSATRGTVGYIHSRPGEHNIIAEFAEVPVDFREADPKIREKLFEIFCSRAQEICEKHHVSHEIKMTLDMPPVKCDRKILDIYEKMAETRKIPHMELISYAAHDSMVLAKLCPVAMLFVRSQKGLSHCPQEWTDLEDLAMGTEILLDTVCHLIQNGWEDCNDD